MLPAGPSRSARTTLRWLTQPYELLREQRALHGDRFTLDLGGAGRFVILSAPNAIRDVFAADPRVLDASEGNAVMRAFLGPGSLLLLEGERHLKERRMLLPAFHRRRAMEWCEDIEDIALEEVRSWRVGEIVCAQHAMQRISLEVILRIVFGVQPGPRRQELRSALLAFLEDPKFNLGTMGRLDDAGGGEAWAGFRRSLGRIRALLRELLSARRASRRSASSRDVLELLLSARAVDGQPLSDEELEDELLTLCVTGFETTATALAWGLYLLHREPEVRDVYVDRWAGRPLAEAVADPYVAATCHEILRIRPVLPIVARRARRDVLIDGWTAPAGAILAPCAYLLHHREDLYPDPEALRPERFLERSHKPHEYIPFGGGTRRCVGMQLALHEMRVVLGTVLSRSRLELESDGPVGSRRRSVTIAPESGPRLRVLCTEEAHAHTG